MTNHIDATQLQYLDELETLRAAGQLFVNSLSLDETLSIVRENALKISQATYCQIFIRDPQDLGFMSVDLHYTGEHPLDALQTFSHRKVVEAIESQRRLQLTLPPDDTMPLKSWLIFPFKSMGNIVGALSLGCNCPRNFEPTIVKLLEIFVDQAANAVSHAQIFEDLTQAYDNLARKNTQILENQNTMQVLLNGISDGLYLLDRDLKIVMINQAEAQHIGQTQSQLVTQPFGDLDWGEAGSDFLETIQRTLHHGERLCWFPPETNNSALTTNREFLLYPIASARNEINQILIFAQDNTRQKNLNATLFHSSNLASIAQLATSVAHEINNPLTVSLTNAQLLLMDAAPGDKLFEVLQDIYSANLRIQEIVANLTSLADQHQSPHEQVDLISTLEAALSMVTFPIRNGGIKLTKNYQATPQVMANAGQLEIVWINMLLNASQSIDAGKAPGLIEVSVSGTDDAGLATITIADNGIGIAAEIADKVFNPFFTTKLHQKAVGLGLFAAHTIIENHHGHITFQNANPGVRFVVSLPTQPPHLF